MNEQRIGLLVSSLVIVVLTASNVWLYTTQQYQINTLQTDKGNLEMWLVMSQREYDAQIANLQGQINTLKAPDLIKLNLEETDVRFGTPYLYVRSIVVNVGSDTANDCKLHVILYQGSVVANETDIILGSIPGRNWVAVDEKVSYTGSSL